MPLLCKQKALYVKGCVIPNGITDSQGDCLHAEEIKRIFTTFNNQDNFEVLHDDIAIPEVSLLENYISTADESIGTLIVPAGSWNCVIRVDNPEIKEKLLTGELGGLSLSNRIAERCKANLRGIIRYKDVADAECIIPKWISFVESGANGYPLHVMDYNVYILKSKDVEFEKDGGKIMDFKEFLTGLKSLIKEAEAPAEEEPAIEKEDEKTEEEKAEETPVEEPAEEETADEEPVVEKAETTEEEEEAETPAEEEPAEIEKADETPAEDEADEPTLEERVAKLEEAIAKLTAEPEEEAEEAETEEETEEEPEDEDTPKITKSEKVVIEETKTPQTSNYYEMTGRDPLTGLKIRK